LQQEIINAALWLQSFCNAEEQFQIPEWLMEAANWASETKEFSGQYEGKISESKQLPASQTDLEILRRRYALPPIPQEKNIEELRNWWNTAMNVITAMVADKYPNARLYAQNYICLDSNFGKDEQEDEKKQSVDIFVI